MHCRIKNILRITLPDDDPTDLTTVSGLEFYVRQVGFFRQYTPVVNGPHEMLVTVPLEDAMQLYPDSWVSLQFAFTDAEGNHVPSDKKKLRVKEFIKREGYGRHE
jgi:hypothetical protein